MSEKSKRYLFEYRHDGAEWGLEITALSPEDAKARLKVIPWATLKGEVVLKGKLPDVSVFGRWWSALVGSR